MKRDLPTFSFRTLINNYRLYIEQILGMDEEAIEKEYQEYQELQPNGSTRDYMWSLFQRMLLAGGDEQVYRDMGRFVSRFEGRNGNLYHRLGLKMEYENNKQKAINNGLVMDITVIGHKSCGHSMKYEDDHSFEDYPEGLPLATEDCELMSCICCYSMVARRDNDGNLIYTVIN